MRELRAAWGTRIGLPSPSWLLEIGTLLMRTESELVLKSRRVVPGRLAAAGFPFLFPDWPAAARELVGLSLIHISREINNPLAHFWRCPGVLQLLHYCFRNKNLAEDDR